MDVAKAQPAVAATEEPHAQIARKAEALQVPPEATAISDGERRAQRRAHRSGVMAKAVRACREGRISAAEVAGLQAPRLRLDEGLGG